MKSALRRLPLLVCGLCLGALCLGALVFSGCSGSNTVSPFNSLRQYANLVLLARYGPAGANPGGNIRIDFNSSGNGGIMTIFDPQFGEVSGPVTVTLQADNTARLSANFTRDSQPLAAGQSGAKNAGQKESIPTHPRSVFGDIAAQVTGTLPAHPSTGTSGTPVNNLNLVLNGLSRDPIGFLLNPASLRQSPLANKRFPASGSTNFTAGSISGNYVIAVSADGSRATLTGNTTSPAAGSFSGNGVITPLPNGQYSLTATAPQGLVTFQGTITLTPANAPTSATITGDVFFNKVKQGTFTTTTSISNPPPTPTTICIEQGSNSLTLNLQNGQYTFCVGGTSFTGTGTVTTGVSGSTFTHNTADRRVLATINTNTRQASATLQAPVGTTRANITDSNYADGTCGACSSGNTQICIEQGSNSFTLNLQNGQYTFCAGGTSFTGTGTVTTGVSGSTFTHNTADRRVLATINTNTRQASALLQAPVGTTRASITDNSFADGACGACSGGPQTRNLTAPGARIVTVRLNGNNSSSVFPDLLEAGDHDEGGHKTVQGFIGFPFSGQGLPTDPAKITNVRLVLTENRSITNGSIGQPFTQLGRLFAERIAQTEFQQIGTAQLPVSDITRTSRIIPTNTTGGFAADVTGIFKEFVRTNAGVANFRLRFETAENNDGNNDIADFFISGTSQPRLEVTFTP